METIGFFSLGCPPKLPLDGSGAPPVDLLAHDRARAALFFVIRSCGPDAISGSKSCQSRLFLIPDLLFSSLDFQRMYIRYRPGTGSEEL